jgi:hypothetical protein
MIARILAGLGTFLVRALILIALLSLGGAVMAWLLL